MNDGVPDDVGVLGTYRASDLCGQPVTDRERCGVVIDAGPHNLYLELDNISPSPEKFFEMDGAVVTRIHNREEWAILGFWHSHPAGKWLPSKTDIEWCPARHEMHILCDGVIRGFDELGQGGWVAR